MYNNNIRIYYQHCILKNNIIMIYCQYNKSSIKNEIFDSLKLQSNYISIPIQIGFYGYDEIIIQIKKDDINIDNKVKFLWKDQILYDNIMLNILYITGTCNTSIVTMIQNYNNRIIEWINYNFKLGFEKIVLFDNLSTDNLSETINKLNDSRIIVIPFNYKTIHPHWNTLQRIVFSVGVNLLQKVSRYVALIDADEFIMIPNERQMNINTFLKSYNETLHIQQVVINNLVFSKEDINIAKKIDNIDNNILDICRYTDYMQDSITKIILFTNYKDDFEWIIIKSPHTINLKIFTHNYQNTLSPLLIYYGHFHYNRKILNKNRYKVIDDFYKFKYS